MQELARYLIVTGLTLAAIGMLILLTARVGFRGLPGDLAYQGDHLRVYFPITTCIVFSLLVSLLAMIWRRWTGR